MPACIRASRASVCYKCNAPIQCNDWIVPDSVQHYARWVHKQCAHSTSEPATPQAHASSVMQAGSDGTQEAAVHRLFMELPFPFRLVLEQLQVMDTVSASTLKAMQALTPSPDSWMAFERHLAKDTAAAAAASGKSTGGEAMRREGRQLPTGASLVQMLVEQKWVEWDSTHTRFRENPQPPSTPPYRQTAAVLLKDKVQGRTSIEIQLHAGNTDTCSYLGRHPEVAAHHRLLWVKSFEGTERVAEQLIMNGLVLGGRQFNILYFKFDKKASTLVFFATKDSRGSSTNPAQTHALPPMSVEAAVAKLGAVQHLWQQPGKMMERMGLFSSSTLPFPLPAAYIYYVDDIAASGVDGSVQGISEIMTDGAGLISTDLAHLVPYSQEGMKLGSCQSHISNGHSSVLQVRLYDPRGPCPIISKGTLTPCAALPPRTVLVTRSMVKAPSSSVLDTWLVKESQSFGTGMPLYAVKHGMSCKDGASMEVVRSSFEVLPGRMNANIVVLLDHACQPERLFTQIVQGEVADIERTETSYEKCFQRAKSTRSTELQQLLEAGIGLVQTNPSSLELAFRPDAYLCGEIARMQQEALQDLQAMRFILPDACRLVGVPDASGSIPPNCCVAVKDGLPLLPPLPPWKPANALLYRDPGLHPSDVQPTKVVEPPPEFYALYGASSNGGCSSNGVSAKGAMGPKLCVSNALFFSTQGAQSLASKLASGDYDGDLYVLIMNREVVESYCAQNQLHHQPPLWQQDSDQAHQQAQKQRPTASSHPQQQQQQQQQPQLQPQFQQQQQHSTIMSGLWGTIQATCSQAGARILFTTPPVATKRGSPCAEPPLGVRQLFGAADAAASGCSEGGSVSGSAARCGSVPGSAARSGSAPGSAAAGTPPRQGLSAAAAVPLPSDDEKEGGGGEGVRWCGGLNGSCGDAGLHAGPKEQGPQQQHLGHQQQQQQQQQGSPFQGSGRLLSGKEIAAAYKQAQAVHMRIGHACNLWKGWSDARGAGAPNAQELAYIYMMALDACKTGTLPSIGPHLRQPLDDQGRVHEPVWDRSKEAQRQAQRALQDGAQFNLASKLYLLALGSPDKSPSEPPLSLDADLAWMPGSEDEDIQRIVSETFAFWKQEWARFLGQPSPHADTEQQQLSRSAFSSAIRAECRRMLFRGCASFEEALESELRSLKVASAFYRLVYDSESRKSSPRLASPWLLCGRELKHIKAKKITFLFGQHTLTDRVIATLPGGGAVNNTSWMEEEEEDKSE